MRAPILTALAVCVALSGCGSETIATDYSNPARSLAARLVTRVKNVPTLATLDAAGTAALRQALEADGQPILRISYPALKYVNLMAPYGQNGPVQTWASQDYETVSLRQGVLVATRGFGADVMTAVAPPIGQISAGSGQTRRIYYYLDGGDQPQRFDYTCTLSGGGSETVIVMGKSYATRKVTESCTGPQGSFANAFWFDGSTKLRQSQQMVAPGLANMMLQSVID